MYVCLVGGLKQNSELNFLEMEFLNMVNWRISYSKTNYEYYLNGVNNFFTSPMSGLTKSIIDQAIGTISSRSNNGLLSNIELSIGISA